MLFRLIIEAPIPPRKTTLEGVHSIRRHLHPQLKRLWEHEPLASRKRWLRLKPESGNEVAVLEEKEGRRYAPLVSQKNALHCSMHVLFLRTEAPGGLIEQRGDIDNRLKTLFDALRVPSAGELRKIAAKIGADDDPTYCLLQNDALITELKVESDRLLTTDKPNETRVIITVKLLASTVTMANLSLLAL
jgi:hypothetical protein